jgi:hypothetical protein
MLTPEIREIHTEIPVAAGVQIRGERMLVERVQEIRVEIVISGDKRQFPRDIRPKRGEFVAERM